ncbi:glycosyltransferase family 4 protein [Candidatus Kuenenbacteria bacterium]|nr:glycosyltransferase family 4 protein [Candidatus Kuenenbacteria bacterium]
MQIVVDASRSVSTIQKTGVELVSDELIKTISNQQSAISNQKIIYYTPQKIDWLPSENQRILRWPFKLLWTQIRLALELIFHPPQVMFFPVHAMPLLFIVSYKLRVTSYYKVIHDIAFKKQPQLYSFKQKFILNLDLWLAKKICTKIFVPTEAVKQDLIDHTKIAPKKIVFVPWGYNAKTQNPINKIQRKKQILYIGRVEEKKNIRNLIKGFQIFSKEHPDCKLILAGKIDERFKIYDLGLKNIELLNYITEEKKHELLRESAVLVLVSKEEGFGFPILEAFDFGLPVVASDIPVLREIGGDACLYAKPDSPEDIATSLEKIISDEKLQAQLITAGHDRLKQFNWPDTAEKILAELSK